MPRKLICVFGSEFYSEHAWQLIDPMVRNQTQQIVHFEKAETPVPVERQSSKSRGAKGLLQRKKPAADKASPPPPYADAVSGAYGFLSKWYQPGDEIILFSVTGTPDDWELLRAAARVLTQHLGAGTEPLRTIPKPDPAADMERDIFGDQPQHDPANNLLGNKVESSVVIIYRSEQLVTEINNSLLDEFPLSVKQIFSFNWKPDRENYCNTRRDDGGQVVSREVCYFTDLQWHIPVVTFSTMSFIRYKFEHISPWGAIKPATPRILESLPAPLLPEFPPLTDSDPICTSPPSSPRPPKRKLTIWFGRDKKSTLRSSTIRSERTAQRSDSLMSAYSSIPLVTFPASTPGWASPISSYSSPAASCASSSDLTQPSRMSVDSSMMPSLREAYIHLAGMTMHQVWTYPAFRNRTNNYYLPERVIWRSSRNPV